MERQRKAEEEAQKASSKASEQKKKESENILEVIKSQKEQNEAYEKTSEVQKKASYTAEQLLNQSRALAKGIDISSFVQKNEQGMANYSNSVQALNTQIGQIEGLLENLKDAFSSGAISEEQYTSATKDLIEKQISYGDELNKIIEKQNSAGTSSEDLKAYMTGVFDGLPEKVKKQSVELIELDTQLKNVKQAIKQLDEDYKAGKISLDNYTVTKAKLKAEESDIASFIKRTSDEMKHQMTVFNSSEGSYNNLAAKYALLKIQINAMGEAEEKNVEQKRMLEAEAKALYDEMNKLQQATGKSQLQVGDYSIATKELTSALSTVNPALGSTVSMIQRMTAASLAFIATPVGAIIAAIVAVLYALKEAFSRTVEGQNALATVMGAFSFVLNTILDLVADVGEWLIKMFTSPKEAIKQLGDFIVSHVLNRLEALGMAGKAIAKIFTGDWKEGLKELGDAWAQGTSGIKDMGNKMVKFVKDVEMAAQSFGSMGGCVDFHHRTHAAERT